MVGGSIPPEPTRSAWSEALLAPDSPSVLLLLAPDWPHDPFMANVQERIGRRGSTWRVKYRDDHGRSRTLTFKTERAAKNFAKAVDTDVSRGDFTDPAQLRTPFSTWSASWLTSLSVAPNTFVGYERNLRLYVDPSFGRVPIGRIDRRACLDFAAQLRDIGLSNASVQRAVAVLRLVLEYAIAGDAIKANPASRLKLPSPEPVEHHYMDEVEIGRLAIETGNRHPEYRTLVLFAGFTGLRASELAGLRLRWLDLKAGVVTVRRTRAELSGEMAERFGRNPEGTTKSHRVRSVPVPAFLFDDLRSLMDGRRPNDPAFTAPGGGPLSWNNFYGRHYKPAVVAAGLDPKTNFHDLRHSYAAMLIAEGAHSRAIMERMGHSSITVTLNTYGHLFPQLDAALTVALDERGKRLVNPG